MFYDPTIVGSWPALAARLDDDAVLARWAKAEPALTGLTTVAALLAVWSEDGGSDCTDVVLAALVRLAAVDGGRDDDALLLTLHLLSGLAWTMAAQLRDLSPDIVTMVVGELACQIRRYPWQRRPRAVAANLRARRDGRCSPSSAPEAGAIPIEASSSPSTGTSLGWCTPRPATSGRTSTPPTCCGGRCGREWTPPTWRCWSPPNAAETSLSAVRTGAWPPNTASPLAPCTAGGTARSQRCVTWLPGTWRPSRDRAPVHPSTRPMAASTTPATSTAAAGCCPSPRFSRSYESCTRDTHDPAQEGWALRRLES